MRELRATAATGTLVLIMGCGMPPTSETLSISFDVPQIGIYEVVPSQNQVLSPDRKYYLNVDLNLRSDDKQSDADALVAAINAMRHDSKQKDISQAKKKHPITFCGLKIYRDKEGNQLGRFSSGIIITIDEICSELAAGDIVSKATLFPNPTVPASTAGWNEVMILQHSIGDEQRDHAAIEPTDDNGGQ